MGKHDPRLNKLIETGEKLYSYLDKTDSAGWDAQEILVCAGVLRRALDAYLPAQPVPSNIRVWHYPPEKLTVGCLLPSEYAPASVAASLASGTTPFSRRAGRAAVIGRLQSRRHPAKGPAKWIDVGLPLAEIGDERRLQRLVLKTAACKLIGMSLYRACNEAFLRVYKEEAIDPF